MDYIFESNASSPATFWSGTTFEEANTPLTEGSLLLDGQGVENTVESSGPKQYILVVGGCGFIGSHTVWELAKAGHNVSPLP